MRRTGSWDLAKEVRNLVQVARIVREGDAVQLTTAEGKEFRAADSESLTERVLGFRLPIEGLADWAQGRPSPALESRGWRI